MVWYSSLKVFDDHDNAATFIKSDACKVEEIVIKASGLYGGKGWILISSYWLKGVFLPKLKSDALNDLSSIMESKSTSKVNSSCIIEDRLCGEEISLLLFTDGYTAKLMPALQDYKRLNNNDQVSIRFNTLILRVQILGKS